MICLKDSIPPSSSMKGRKKEKKSLFCCVTECQMKIVRPGVEKRVSVLTKPFLISEPHNSIDISEPQEISRYFQVLKLRFFLQRNKHYLRSSRFS